jgi:hypothetical protein
MTTASHIPTFWWQVAARREWLLLWQLPKREHL